MCRVKFSGNMTSKKLGNTKYWLDELSPLDMVSRMRTLYCHRLNKGFNTKFPECYRDWQVPDEVWRAQWLKCDNNNNNKNEDNRPSVNVIRNDLIISIIVIFSHFNFSLATFSCAYYTGLVKKGETRHFAPDFFNI